MGVCAVNAPVREQLIESILSYAVLSKTDSIINGLSEFATALLQTGTSGLNFAVPLFALYRWLPPDHETECEDTHSGVADPLMANWKQQKQRQRLAGVSIPPLKVCFFLALLRSSLVQDADINWMRPSLSLAAFDTDTAIFPGKPRGNSSSVRSIRPAPVSANSSSMC